MIRKNGVTYGKEKIFLHHLIIIGIIIVAIVLLSFKNVLGSEVVPPTAPVPLTVYTDKLSYVGNDTIVISGNAQLTDKEDTILVQIFDPQTMLIVSHQTSVSSDGTYLLRIHSNFGIAGIYIVRSTLKNGYNTERPFLFIVGPYKLMVNHTQYQINYNMTSGLLNDIYAGEEDKSLTLSLANVTSSTKFTINLPRNLIDSKLLQGDSNFAVLISTKESDFRPANFIEEHNDSSSRTLSIGIPYDGIKNPTGRWNVKIIGTSFVPAIPTVVTTILANSFVALLYYQRIQNVIK